MSEKQRLDQHLVDKGYFPTKSQAALAIKRGDVKLDGIVVTKPGHKVSENRTVEIAGETYVGRGAYKMKAACEVFEIDPKEKNIADIGSSTGGFTDYLLQNGAQKVFAIDVGTNQLAEKLRNDERVVVMEGTNIKDVASLPDPIDVCVIDVSHISLTKILPHIKKIVGEKVDIIALCKPQFEAGQDLLNKQGIVSDEDGAVVAKKFRTWLLENGFSCNKYIESPIRGKKGNKEFLFKCRT